MRNSHSRMKRERDKRVGRCRQTVETDMVAYKFKDCPNCTKERTELASFERHTHFRCSILIYVSSGNNGFFCPADMRSKGIETSQYEMEVRQSSFKYSVCFGISELVKVSYVPGGNAGVVPLLLRCRLHFEFDIPFPPRFCFHIPKNMSTGTQRARNRER